MTAKRLRAVTPDEKAVKQPSTVTQAVQEGDRRDQLLAMRARIARAIDEPNIRGADLAALSRRMLEIGREIEALDAAHDEEAADAAVEDERFDASAV